MSVDPPCGVLSTQLCIFELDAILVPSIFSTNGLGSTRKHSIIFPRGDPALEPLERGYSPQSVTNRKDRHATMPLWVEVVLALAKESSTGDVEAGGPGHTTLKLLKEESQPLHRFPRQQQQISLGDAIEPRRVVGHRLDEYFECGGAVGP